MGLEGKREGKGGVSDGVTGVPPHFENVLPPLIDYRFLIRH